MQNNLMVYENIVYDSICGFATKKLRFNTIELIPRILLRIALYLFWYIMRLYVNSITTPNDNSWMMLIWAAEILQSHSDKIKSFCSFLIFQTKAIERKTCRIEMLYIASKLSILMVSHNHDIYCQIGLLYKKKMKRKLFDIHIKEFIIKIAYYAPSDSDWCTVYYNAVWYDMV